MEMPIAPLSLRENMYNGEQRAKEDLEDLGRGFCRPGKERADDGDASGVLGRKQHAGEMSRESVRNQRTRSSARLLQGREREQAEAEKRKTC